MNIIVNSDRTVEKEYTEKDGSQNENRVTELNFTLPEEYSGEGFVPKIAFITEDGNFSDYIDNGKYILKNNITKYREVICFVWLTNSVNNIDFRSQTFPLEFYYNEDPSDYIPSEQEKSQIELLMEELEEKIQEVTELEENVYTKDETYSKEEVDEIIPTDISDLNNDSGFIDKDVNNLTNYYKKSETYTKQEIDGKISSVYKYKGTVASYNNLPSTGLTIGDVYNVEDTGDNYAWTGTDWDKLGGDIDLSGYQEKIDNSHKLNADLVDDSNSINKFTSATEKNSWNAKYNKPSGGIPSTDMSSSVQTSLEKAETAIQDVSGKEDKSNKTGILDENSTDTQYPNAKTVYDNFVTRDEEIEKLQTENAQLLADHPDILDENNEFPSGTDLTLNGTGDLEMSVDVGGNSTQESTTGANLQKFSSRENSSYNYKCDEKGQVIINGTVTSVVTLGYNLSTNPMTLTAGTYKMKVIGNMSSNTLILNNQGSTISLDSNKEAIITLNADTSNYYIQIYLNTGTHNDDFYITLASGTTATTERYTGGTASPNPTYKQDINNVEGDVVVKGSSKNWFNESLLAQETNYNTYNNGIWTTYNQSAYNRSILYDVTGTTNLRNISKLPKLKPNTQYTIKFFNYTNNTGLNPSITLLYINNNGNIISDLNCGDLKVFTTPENCEYLDITRRNNTGTISFSHIMIVEGSYTSEQLQSYVPFAENSVTFPLSQGQKLMLGDTLEDTQIRHKYGEYTVTGNEPISSYEVTSNGCFAVNIGIRCKYAVYTGTETYWLASHLMPYALTEIRGSNPKIGICVLKDGYTYVNLTGGSSTLETVRELWRNLAGMKIYYLMQEETTETYTQAQQTAYNKLKEMQSYYDLTYVTGSSDNAQPIITAHAKKSLKVMNDEISNINSRLTLLEE